MPGTIIKTRYSDVTNQPAPDALVHAEQAYSFASNRLFIGKLGGATVDPIMIGGKYYTDMMNQTRGVLTADAAILVDSNKWVDNLISGSLKLTTSGGGGQVVSAIVTSLSGTPTDAQLITAAGAKTYVDTTLAAFSLNDISDVVISSPADAHMLIYDNTAATWKNYALSGSLTTTKTGVVTLSSTGVTAGQYGGQTAIPVITVTAEGRISALSTVTVATTLNVAGDTGTDGVAILSDTLTFTGGAGITTTVTNNTVTIDADATVARNTDTLNYFSATTSAQLASVISDETGTGLVVFGTSPNFTTSVTTGSNSFDVFNANATTVNAFGAATTLQFGATTGTTTVRNSLVVGGNLTVQGITTSVNSTTTTLTDPVIILAQDSIAAGDANDRGVRFNWGNGTSVVTGFFGMDMQTGRFVFKSSGAESNTENYSAPWSDAQFGEIYGTGGTLGNITVGVATDNTITTTSGTLTLTAANTTVAVTGDLGISNALNVTGTVTFTSGLAVSSGGTGVQAFTGKAVAVTNTGGTALSFVTGTSQFLAFDSSGTPIATATIDGGTF